MIKNIEPYYIQIVETLVVVVLYFIVRQVSLSFVRKHLLKEMIHEARGKAVKKIIGLVLQIISITFILLIWGVKQSDLAIFFGSVVAVVGVAFFAQWSLLSNITSSVILFFSHPIKLNDEVAILEGKDYVVEGKVKDISLFFITLETGDGEEVTLPNNIFIAKSIKIKTGLEEVSESD